MLWYSNGTDNKLEQNAERYGVREGSPVGVQWAVQWVGEDRWWEGFVELEQV